MRQTLTELRKHISLQMCSHVCHIYVRKIKPFSTVLRFHFVYICQGGYVFGPDGAYFWSVISWKQAAGLFQYLFRYNLMESLGERTGD